jgi:Tol biopolymer transport system component
VLPNLGGAPANGGAAGVCVDWLVYHTNQTGDWEVFRLGDIPGKAGANANLSQGVGANIDDIGASLSPNKAWVAFSSNRDGNFEIYIGATDGSSQRRITKHPGFTATDPVWAPDGVNIAYESNQDGDWNLYMVNTVTGAERRLTYSGMPSTNASFSPGGTYIVFEGVVNGLSQLFLMNVGNLNVTKLSDGKGNDRNPVYSHDGRYISYYSFRNGPAAALYIMNSDGTNPVAVSDKSLSAINESWSPDSSLIAYQAQNGTDLGVYVYQLATGKTRRVTDTSSVNYAPTWFCRGNTLIFTSDVTGDPNIYSTSALPIDAAPIKVDEKAVQMTSDKLADQYAAAFPPEEDASTVGPQSASLILPSLGGEPAAQTQCGSVTRADVAGGSTGFPTININTCAKK